MKKKNLAAWKFLNFLKKQQTRTITANLWHEIFIEIEEELNRDENGDLSSLDMLEKEYVSEVDTEIGSIKIMTLVMEAYNRYLSRTDERTNERIAKMNSLGKNREKNPKNKTKNKSEISEIVKSISDEQQIHQIMRIELEMMIIKIGSAKLKQEFH